jgi:hypothetical protein
MTFDALAERLHRNPANSLGRGVTDAEINIASFELGVELNGGYRLFLKRFGWAGIGSIELFGLGTDVPPYLNLTAMTRSEREDTHTALPTHLVPLMNDGGGNFYCLDTRVPEESPVVFWDHTAGARQEPRVVAADFTHWLTTRVEQESMEPTA